MLKTSKQHGPSTRRRLEQYFIIAGTLHDTKVTHILFYGGKEASEQWTALKDQVDQNKLNDPNTVFKAFANSLRRAPVTGRPGRNIYQTSSRPSTRPWLN